MDPIASTRRQVNNPLHPLFRGGPRLTCRQYAALETTMATPNSNPRDARSSPLAAFLFMLVICSFVGCASTPTQERTGEFFDDSIITTKIKMKLFGEPSLKSFDIEVETFKGRVQLSGFVATQTEIDKAAEIARSVKGVVDVKNNLLIK